MKKRIHLTENQLHRLIEQSINEISTQTKMSAANKAAREKDRYWDELNDPNNPNQVLARKKWNKRRRQSQAFEDAVDQETDSLSGVVGTTFIPSYGESSYNPRGDMYTSDRPILFGKNGRLALNFPDDERDKKFNDVEQFLNGNSYYEKGRGWVNPDDEGYDMERSEPWAKIRRNNESIAHRVNEGIDGYEDWEWLLDFIESDGELRRTIDWVIQACVKKARRGVVLDREHLANCYTLRRLCQIGVKMCAENGDRLYLSNEDKRKVREELADFILSFVNNEIESQNESVARRVTESVMRKLREEADPFEHINRVWDGIFYSWKEGLFDGMGFDKYLQWKMNGRTNLPSITRNEAYDMLDAISDKLGDLWSDGQGDSELANQLAHIEGDLIDIVQLM